MLFAPATMLGQVLICPGEPIVFQVPEDYYGTKTWEFSADGVMWTTVEVTENEPFTLQPEQAGWYRVRFYDADCDISYTSEPTRFALPSIDLGGTMTLRIGGRVTNETGGAVQGATVRAGCGAGTTTTTDQFGVFLLEGVTAYERLAMVTVEKEGYFRASRSFVPTENAEETISNAYMTLLPKNVAGTVDASAGGAVELEGMNIQFPANAFMQDGQPYAGTVSVALNHIDPTSEDMSRQMPGMLMGVMDTEPQLMLSYGMAAVELSDANGDPVDLAPGSTATVRFPLMAAQQATAPETMPLWWFDEDIGYWVQEGDAQLVGNAYVGEVAHFSWWNCDVPSNFVLINGVVSDEASGSLLPNAEVRLISTTMGSGTTYTDGRGEFTGMVPIGEALTLQVWMPCGTGGTQALIHEQIVGPFTVGEAITVLVDLPTSSLIMGNVLDCAGVPVEQGYVWASGQAVFCDAGAFQFISCATSLSLRGVDLLADSVSAFLAVQVAGDTTMVGDLTTCIPLFGSVSDIDGNTYLTVLIGEQEWMADNLKTTRYRDGSPIPNVTDNTAWAQSNSGAWCNFNNSPANDAIYGKLYNWYAAANPAICPQGWHVPTDAEWQQLELFLGMPTGELNITGTRGTAQNVGGKLKATTLWNAPNAGATNESGFSALPGGNRNDSGNFSFLNITGYLWSASENGEDLAWQRLLSTNVGGISRSFTTTRYGLCVRCLRD